ncbi:MAG TPA: hypothetical protein VES36_03430 [Candidatus Limnocylindrales bacterium]|nr:hypothetical protein [Candidatus Limnocylindrales bacterium]
MRDVRIPTAERRSFAWIILVVALVSWLVVQNGVLLLMWSWPVLPALLAVARALLKVAGIVAVQLMPAALVAGGVALLWVAARRTSPPAGRRLEGVRHG